MKKIIALLLSFIMVFTLAVAVNASGKGHESKGKTSSTSIPAVSSASSLQELLTVLKSTQMNSELKNKLLKLIVDYRKKKGDNTIPVFLNNVPLTLSSPAVVKGYTVYLPASTLVQVAGAVITEGDSQLIAAIPASALSTTPTYIIIDKRTGKITKNGSEQKSRDKAQSINNNRKLYIPAALYSGSLGFTVQYNKTNGALMIYSNGFKPAVLTAPTAVSVTPVGGTVVANALNSTNTNMTATAVITPGQATGGKAELLVGTAIIATDAAILATDAAVTFDLGKTTSEQIRAAIAAGGVVSVRLYDTSNNTVTSSVGNPALIVDYTVPAVSSAIFTNATTLTIVFSEAVNAAAVDFTDGRFIDANDANITKAFAVSSLAGSGTNILILTIAPTAALVSGYTGFIDISSAVKDLSSNNIVSVDNRGVASGF